MNAFILLLIWSLPLLLAVFAGGRHARWIMLIAPLPALIAAVILPVGTHAALPWLLLGIELGLDDTGRVFLVFSSLVWLLAGMFAAGSLESDRHAARFRVFFLLAMAGNLGLIVAQDIVSFYLGFAVMGLAAYGLIAHPASLRARRAARRYLAWTIAGELILFVAVVMLAQQHSGALTFDQLKSAPPNDVMVLLLIIGFGIKLALPGLHFWLPRSYAVAPTPAVAVLSGVMIKAGLLGWLRFLPPGDEALIGWGQVLIIVGVAGMLYGAVGGLLQQRARLLLGYSSISKMGVLTAGVGAALAWPAAAPALIGAVVVFAAHHALVKSALFLGLGLVERGGLRTWVWAGLGFLALSLAGAPLTSGALAKSMLTMGLPQDANTLLSLLAVSAVTTTLLMGRFLFLIWKRQEQATSPHAAVSTLAWLTLLALIAVFPFAMTAINQLFPSQMPLLLGALLAAAALLITRHRSGYSLPQIPQKATRRLIAPFRRLCQRLTHSFRDDLDSLRSACLSRYASCQHSLRAHQQRRKSDFEGQWPLAGGLWLGIGGLLLSVLVLTA